MLSKYTEANAFNTSRAHNGGSLWPPLPSCRSLHDVSDSLQFVPLTYCCYFDKRFFAVSTDSCSCLLSPFCLVSVPIIFYHFFHNCVCSMIFKMFKHVLQVHNMCVCVCVCVCVFFRSTCPLRCPSTFLHSQPSQQQHMNVHHYL